MKEQKQNYITIHFNESELKQALDKARLLRVGGYEFSCGEISADGNDFLAADKSGHNEYEFCVQLVRNF